MSSPQSRRVTFVLPHATDVPIGGYKSVYEFANGLVERGYSVTVVLPWLMHPVKGAISEIKCSLRPLIHKLRKPHGISWFKIDPRVNLVFCSDLREKWLPASDFVVATSWRTVEFVAGYSGRLGKKLYLVQHLETFGGPYDEVIATWKAPLHKLTIAKWLGEFAEKLGEKYTPIRVGVDMHEFGLDIPIAGRPPVVSMLYGDSYVKASWDGINAIEVVKEKIPGLKAIVFGNPTRPPMPDWIEYRQSIPGSELRKVYNQTSVFIHPSWGEGWPAPPAEAMACGAAVAGAANPGFMDYAKPGVTALISRPKYWTELADNVLGLLQDEALRTKIAQAGHEDVQQYSWERACERLAEVLGRF